MAPTPFQTMAPPMNAERDPLGRFRDGAVHTGSGRPIPLAATRIQILVAGGLAVVRTERVFRNAEDVSIEATLTFPVPVHATLFGLSACVGGRALRATARRREQAREAYEDAIDRGKTTVLHEEALRGVHMLSVAHVPPGAEVTVASDWAMPLSATADGHGAAILRIPTTVGDLYGRPPLADSDDLATDAAVVHEAELEVRCAEGEASLAGGPALADGRVRLRLDRPIDLCVSGWAPRELHGLTADGHGVALRIAPAPVGETAIDAVVLVDRSASMGSPAGQGAQGALTKHAAVVAGLRTAAAALRPTDRVHLWEFDDAVNPVRPRRGGDFPAAVAALGAPRGGTETGAAIAAVLAAEVTQDVVLITDGQTWALDVQAVARSGRRFTVVLIGEDSLEANVGHLAALTGGQIFVAGGGDVAAAVRLALAALRCPHRPAPVADERPTKAEALIGGMHVAARLGAPQTEPVAATGADDLLPRAVGAVAAALVLPRLPEATAAALAEAEGLCCHLTSLVLVDEEGAARAGVPAQRKVPLMAPSVMAACATAPTTPISGASRGLFRARTHDSVLPRLVPPKYQLRVLEPMSPSDECSLDIPTFLRRQKPPTTNGPTPGAGTAAGLASARGRIDWAQNPESLRLGILDDLAPGLADALRQAAGIAEVVELARTLGVPPLVVAVALLAQAEATTDRSAARVARAVLRRADPSEVAGALLALGL
ncbi:VIT domain-containing protein [Siccirubricoccus sp. G192]|uniref:VIT domain-containing protein n=1 Tax=Siccirubricoccus sp. G192 TaxID=2849651 RepID=UPI001C2CA829|nr:VIT domain-containing protein [Siccirubricoccus sp. G192]MBV1800503.1 VWA domain-containing protein [Siccirubricoccus sp. G192]